jgi:uncharacterized membrane protein YgcG
VKQRTSAPSTTVTPRQIRIARRTLLGLLAAIVLLIFAVPRTPVPPPSPAQPGQAFVDRIGLVSPRFAREWAGALLVDPRFELVIYVDARPPTGDVASWTMRAASDWRVGAAKNDTGLVLFVFTEPRIARLQVGYGLEHVLTDARVAQLLGAHLAPAFAERQYERGFDATIKAIREEMGGDAGAARAMEAWVKAPREGFVSRIPSAFARTPRLVSATGRNYLEGGPGARLAILVFAAVGLGIAALGLVCAINAVWLLATIPARLRRRTGRGGAGHEAAGRLVGDLKLFEIAAGIGGFAVCLAMTALILLASEDFLSRRGCVRRRWRRRRLARVGTVAPRRAATHIDTMMRTLITIGTGALIWRSFSTGTRSRHFGRRGWNRSGASP